MLGLYIHHIDKSLTVWCICININKIQQQPNNCVPRASSHGFLVCRRYQVCNVEMAFICVYCVQSLGCSFPSDLEIWNSAIIHQLDICSLPLYKFSRIFLNIINVQYEEESKPFISGQYCWPVLVIGVSIITATE